MTYTQFLEFLAQAYEKYASNKKGDVAFLCLTIGSTTSCNDELAVQNLFEDFSGYHIQSDELKVHRNKIIDTIEENCKNCCPCYPDIDFCGSAYNVQLMRKFLKTRVKNPNKLRAMLLRKWAEESVLE